MPLPLHIRYTQAEGPLDAYKRATGDWTSEMQQNYEQACANADRRVPFAPKAEYRCPECHELATGIQVDSVTFYESTDRLHHGPVAAEAQLIRIEDCGHSYRRGSL